MKFKFTDRKTLTQAAGVGAGLIGGTMLSESGALSPITSFAGPQYTNYMEAAIKVLGGGYIYKKMKGDIVKAAGLGFAASGVVDLYQAISTTSTAPANTTDTNTSNTDVKTEGLDNSINGYMEDESITGGYPDAY